ncbi:serine carboxypeptidase [Trichophyton violaceum]|uniref:Carboxypeptidase n=1 Tax=Trichophyton violaceum TaxID=34388 RepID=A0A178FQE9_TRIVO|nr:serine carboxypeptidase [Trichophyton violaceum]
MRFTQIVAAALCLGATEAAVAPIDRARKVLGNQHAFDKRDASGDTAKAPKHLTSKNKKFYVDPNSIPGVPFDIGESYAGNLANTPAGNSSLFFWYFPSENPEAKNEITIWLNGGPGCSSMIGLLQENGPFLWQPGTDGPVKNPYAWSKLTNMVWVDQPAGTGFSPGPPTVKDEIDVANQFSDFWKNFMDTFDLHHSDVYLAGESYAGQYIPYIASGMLDRKDSEYFNVQGITIIDPSIGATEVIIDAPSVPALHRFNNIIDLNETFVNDITKKWESCGYKKFMDDVLRFPPAGPMTVPGKSAGCDVWDEIITAVKEVNPCFNIYHLRDNCPSPSNVMNGPKNFFNNKQIQEAIHAHPTDYRLCGESQIFGPHRNDRSVPSSYGPLASVIERTNNTIIAHGDLDFLLFTEGSLASIQNMTWGGLLGFQKEPSDKFYVPYKDGSEVGGAGFVGKTHRERGLTWVTVDLAGHEIPQYAPTAAYRMLEYMLGRVQSLTETH